MSGTCVESPIRNGRGYGKRRDQKYLHRWVWEQINGPIPEGMVVRHTCDNPACFLYDHLLIGTAADNVADMMSRGRGRGQFKARTHCPHGHEYTPENTKLNSRGHKLCVTCSHGWR